MWQDETEDAAKPKKAKGWKGGAIARGLEEKAAQVCGASIWPVLPSSLPPLRGPQSSAPVAKACWIQEKKAVVENLKMKAKVVKF